MAVRNQAAVTVHVQALCAHVFSFLRVNPSLEIDCQAARLCRPLRGVRVLRWCRSPHPRRLAPPFTEEAVGPASRRSWFCRT